MIDGESVALSAFDGEYRVDRVHAMVQWHVLHGDSVIVLMTLGQIALHRYGRNLELLINHGYIHGIPMGATDVWFIAQYANKHGCTVITNEVLPLSVPQVLHFAFVEANGGEEYRNVTAAHIQYPPGVVVNNVALLC